MCRDSHPGTYRVTTLNTELGATVSELETASVDGFLHLDVHLARDRDSRDLSVMSRNQSGRSAGMTMVSIIIPCYVKTPQQAALLDETLSTVDRQTVADYEAIVVDPLACRPK